MRYTKEVKSFHDLIEEVQSHGICGRCGGCVSFCSASDLNALRFNRGGEPRFADEEKCLQCGICYLVCPQIKALNKELKEQFHWKKPAGSFKRLFSARTTDSTVASLATDGGVVTSLLLFALENRLIEGAIVSHKTGPFARLPFVAMTKQEVIDAAGSCFDDAAHLGEVGKSYTSFVPTIREISKLRTWNPGRMAIVATPCQVYSLRKMQLLKVVPSDAIELVIGLFCMENFSFTKTERRKMEKSLGVDLSDVVKMNIKDDVILTMNRGTTLHVPFNLIDQIAKQSCFACSDFANEFADISCGGIGSADGYTTVMVRTGRGEQIYNEANQKGFVEELRFDTGEESLSYRNTLMTKIAEFTVRKRERAARVLGGR